MVYVVCCLILSMVVNGACAAETAEPTMTVHVSAHRHAPMKMVVMTVGEPNAEMATVSEALKRALEFSKQWSIEMRTIAALPTKADLQELFAHKIPYVLFLDAMRKDSISWRLYETATAHMIKGKRQSKAKGVARAWGYAIADDLWLELAGHVGMFSTKIAYCKEVSHGAGHHAYKHIYIADFDGANEQPLITTPTINVAPRWNNDFNRPLLFYSENTNMNMRMMASTMDKKRVMASNFDGLNMQPTFSPDGSCVVYCATRGSGSCQLLAWHKGSLKCLTHNDGRNLFPTFSSDGKTIYFCSDFEHDYPLLYSLDVASQAVTKLTESGFCVSPTQCAHKDMIAYCKMVNGVMQLFVYSTKTKEHKQLTCDAAQKEECIFSPCGTYLLCSYAQGNTSRIALYNVVTKEYRMLTPATDKCSYPALSGVYAEYPVVG